MIRTALRAGQPIRALRADFYEIQPKKYPLCIGFSEKKYPLRAFFIESKGPSAHNLSTEDPLTSDFQGIIYYFIGCPNAANPVFQEVNQVFYVLIICGFIIYI